MEGGLIHYANEKAISGVKSPLSVSAEVKKIVKLITFPNSEITRVGSSTFKIQKYFSDVDISNIIILNLTKREIGKVFAKGIQKMVRKIKKKVSTYFSDFKAKDLHWTEDEILSGVHSSGVKLADAVVSKGVVKLDIITLLYGRFIEASTFYMLNDGTNFINVSNDYFDTLLQSLKKDIKEFRTKKPFKAVKRLWSYAKIEKNKKVLNALAPLINSNISLLSQINADFETLILLFQKYRHPSLISVGKMLDSFKDKLANIIDIELPDETIYKKIDKIIARLDENDFVIHSLEELHDLLLRIINNETKIYLKSINFKL